MTMLEMVFVGCFFLGLAYAVISAIFGGIFGGAEGGGEGGAEGGHFDVDHDIVGHVDAGGGSDSGTIHFSPLSPVVVAMFITAFGAMGMICLKVFKWSPYPSMAIAVFTGLVIASVTFIIFTMLFKATQGSSEAILADVIGKEAEVITSIPADGLGEVAYVSRGTRYTASARAAQKNEIKSHSVVIVEKIVGNTFYVKSTEVNKVL
jgi:membrane protein implicated in regulation of membrane protease activity